MAFGQAQADAASRVDDEKAIQQIEADFLKAERITDIAVLERVLADDYVNVVPRGLGPNKAELAKNLEARAGQTPPYSVETKDMRVYVLGDTAVATFLKTYTAKENSNVAQEEATHIFTKDRGVWKLRVSRASVCPAQLKDE